MLGTGVKRANRHDTRPSRRQFARHQCLQREHDLAADNDGILACIRVGTVCPDAVNDDVDGIGASERALVNVYFAS